MKTISNYIEHKTSKADYLAQKRQIFENFCRIITNRQEIECLM